MSNMVRPCRAEMPALEAYFRQHRDDGLLLLVISTDDPRDEAKVRDFMKAFSFPGALARDADIKGYGRVCRLPLTFVVDCHGILRKDDWYGDPGLDVPLLEKTVTPLLRTPRSGCCRHQGVARNFVWRSARRSREGSAGDERVLSVF